ncbi:hypothetical protein Bbelb_140690 [Branchiostoma belcheri]|nr:hypothetical protein Bbelb_140690 [Branchiostoma belcheri]
MYDKLIFLLIESCGELCSEGQQPVQVFSTDSMRLVMAEAPSDRRTDWTRPDDLKTKRNIRVSSPDVPVQTRPDEGLKVEDSEVRVQVTCRHTEEFVPVQVRPEGRLSRLVWLSKPVDLKTLMKEMKTFQKLDETADFEDRVMNADPETGLQQEEEPDFCRLGCVKENGEE